MAAIGGGPFRPAGALAAGDPQMAVRHGAAAGGKDQIGALGQFGDNGLFAGAETGFAFQFKDERDAGPGALLDFLIAIHELAVQHLRQSAADGGLAGAHRANQKQAGDGGNIGDGHRSAPLSALRHHSLPPRLLRQTQIGKNCLNHIQFAQAEYDPFQWDGRH